MEFIIIFKLVSFESKLFEGFVPIGSDTNSSSPTTVTCSTFLNRSPLGRRKSPLNPDFRNEGPELLQTTKRRRSSSPMPPTSEEELRSSLLNVETGSMQPYDSDDITSSFSSKRRMVSRRPNK